MSVRFEPRFFKWFFLFELAQIYALLINESLRFFTLICFYVDYSQDVSKADDRRLGGLEGNKKAPLILERCFFVTATGFKPVTG